MRPATDVILGGRYRLGERIAGGGMGEVWRAEDTVLGRVVAVKILRREYADDATFLARFRAEARNAASLSHPHIAAVYDFGEGGAGSGWRAAAADDDRDGRDGRDDGAGSPPYLVMEHVDGEPLSSLVSREGEISPGRTVDIVRQTALGLQCAHDAGVIHRDIKPGNILITPEGMVKITDFGISRATNSVPLTQTGAIMGTAYYISPEQASGQSVTPASDVYSLGIVAYECLTGRRPFPGDTPVSVALAQVSQQPPALPEDLPAPVRALVMEMLAKDPAGRPSGAGVLGARALALAASLGTPAAAPDLAATTAAAPAVAGALATAPTPDAAPDPAYDGPVTPNPPAPGTPAPHVTAGRLGTDTDPGFRLPEERRRPHWLGYAGLAALAALVLMLGLRACDDGAADPSANASARGGAAEPTPTPTATIEVVARDYLGRPALDVRAELSGLGLAVELRRSPGGGVVGTVKDVTPTGALPGGSRVVLDAVGATGSGAAPASGAATQAGNGAPGEAGKPGKRKSNDKGRGPGRDG